VNLDGVTWTDDMTRVLDDAKIVGQPSADRGAASYSVPIITWAGSLAVGEVAHVTYQVTISETRGDGNMPNGVIGVGPASNCPSVGAAMECQTLALVLPAGVDLDPTDPGELPRTGGNTTGILTVAFLLLAVGLGLEALRRRRRRPARS
jgi:LPXTG-motif cell wall-anchored protein